MTFGFLVVGRDLVVQPECTRSCYRLFETEQIEGVLLCDLLGLTGRARQEYGLGIDQIFEDILPSEVSLTQLRNKFMMPHGTVLHVDGSVVRNETNDVQTLLFTISDHTALETATRENQHNHTLVSILRQKESFQAFVLEFKHQLAAAQHIVTEPGAIEMQQAIVRQLVHTIKGNAASYGLHQVVNHAHSIEEATTIPLQQLRELEQTLRSFLQSNHAVLGLLYDEIEDEGFQVTREQMDHLKTLLKETPAFDRLRDWTTTVLKKPMSQLLGPIQDFSERLAVRLGKHLFFEITGEQTLVDVETMRPIAQIISHLVRNAIDHGIENPLQRGTKPPTGTIRLTITEQAEDYLVEVSDDGRGINIEVLAARAIRLGVVDVSALPTMSTDEKIALVFIDGLSSAEMTTSISGRGVGMSAVKSGVATAGGIIQIKSQKNRGTTVRITVPKTCAVPADQPAHRNREKCFS